MNSIVSDNSSLTSALVMLTIGVACFVMNEVFIQTKAKFTNTLYRLSE